MSIMFSCKFDYTKHIDQLVVFFKELEKSEVLKTKRINKMIRKLSPKGMIVSKSELIKAYRHMAGQHGLKPLDNKVIKTLQAKPVRTISGVTPVTVLTKPFPCPGKCIFCPSDVRMPKSYLADEPGAQRAERNWFDPYLQTYNRLQALHDIGHDTNKVEVIVLGGTWSFYPENYQIWFIKECFRALNDFGHHDGRQQIQKKYQQTVKRLQEDDHFALVDKPDDNKKAALPHDKKLHKFSKSYNQVISELYVAPEKKLGLDKLQISSWQELESQHKLNEKSDSRCVGLVIETRPDNISRDEVIRIRRLGCTKVQIGVQSLQDQVLKKNHRGHTVAQTRTAFRLLRQMGFKIHAHWMANLYGSSVQLDKEDYSQLFSDLDFKPDELKIYPCSLIKSAELMKYYQAGKWQPYDHDQLLSVLSYVLTNTPSYCRLTRVIRDIPSPDIVVGNKKTNFRQIVEQSLNKQNLKSKDIRAREIRGAKFKADALELKKIEYSTSIGDEIFLQFVTNDNKIVAFLRLSLPSVEPLINELKNSALIREIHVYGPALKVGHKDLSKAQHLGLGNKLIKEAKQIAHDKGYKKLNVISSVGTREYYRKKGFKNGQLYQSMVLS